MLTLTHKVFSVAVLTAGCIVLILAMPRLRASLSALRPIAYLDSLSPTDKISEAQISQIKPELANAIRIQKTGQYFEAYGILDRQLAAVNSISKERRLAALKDSRQALRASLAYACANPYTWLGLAQVEEQLGGAAEAIIGKVALSMLIGPAEPSLYLERLNLALKYYSSANDDIRPVVARQLRSAWKYRRNETLKLVMQYQKQAVLSAALSHAPGS